MPVGGIAGFWCVSFLLVLTPGADWAYMINAGRQQRSIPPAVTGLLVGYLALTAVVATGVGTLVAGSPMALTALTAVGACYLAWLGLTRLIRPAGPVSDSGGKTGSSLRLAGKGAGISGLNPKALLLFLALMPQFTTRSATWPIAGQIMLLGFVHMVNCAIVYTAVGLGTRKILSSRPAWARTVSRCSGGAMVAIGATLLIHQFAG